MSDRDLLPRALRQPEVLPSLDLAAWDLLVRQARAALLLPRLAVLAEHAGVLDRLPTQPRRHLYSARRQAVQHQRIIRWEVNRVARALRGLSTPIVLLKGAAYVVADLPPAQGRVVSDVDILVPRDRLDGVEQALLAQGWAPEKLDAYDQRYYRRWMHELPPLRHRTRQTSLDVHHNILPQTVKLAPDPQKLLAAAVPIEAMRGPPASGTRDSGAPTASAPSDAGPASSSPLRVLAPEDMTLHSAAHLFYDGELEHGLRDLMDLDALLRHFAAGREGYGQCLVARATELRLERPLYYALRYVSEFLGTPLPPPLRGAAGQGAPALPLARLMDGLFRRALAADHASCADALTPLARWLLYVRSHHLRMPPHLLLPHLLRKALRRRQ